MSSIVDTSLQTPVLKLMVDLFLGLQTTILSQMPCLSVVVATAMRDPSAAIYRTG